MNKCMKVADTSFYREKADKEAKILERMNLLLEQSSQISLNVQVEEFVTVKTKSDQTHIIFIPQKSFAMLALRKIANGKAVGGTFQFFTDSVKARNSAQFTYSANYDKYLDRWYMIVKHDMSFDIVEEAATIANRAKKIEEAKKWDKGLAPSQTAKELAEQSATQNAEDAAQIAADTASVQKYNWDAK